MSSAPLMPCHLVNTLSTNPLEQCKFLIDNDCLEDESFVDYVYLIYCTVGYDFRFLSAVLVIILVILLFLAISAIADDFLCTSLLSVSRSLQMSDSLAGVTLLAFGNGCPDIFSSLAAAYDARSEMIIGELLGAGIFCTSVVSGLVFINSDFKLACRPILRDSSFYLLAVYLIWSYSWNGRITFNGALTFIVLYLVYLTVALGGQMLSSRFRGDYAIEQCQQDTRLEKLNGEENGTWFKRREESLKKRQPAGRPKAPAVVRIDYNEGVTSVHLGSDVGGGGGGGGGGTVKRKTRAPLEIQLFSSLKTGPPNERGFTNKGFVHETAAAANQSANYEAKSKSHGREQQAAACGVQGPKLLEPASEVSRILAKNMSNLSEWDSFLAHINPIEISSWQTTSLTMRIIRILRAPMVLVAQITVPVVDDQKILNNWCRPLNALHLVTVPMFIMLTSGLGLSQEGSLSGLLGLPAPVVELLGCALLASCVLATTSAHQVPRYHAAFAYVGFAMSVYWVYLLAHEMISLMKTIGLAFGMSDTAIGLGILAWGNSLGDIVANYSLTKANYPRMALGACIGAPLLNLLLGFGLSFTISLQPGQSSPIQYSPTITLLCSTLAIILLCLMLVTLTPPSASKRPIGFLLIAGYLVYFVAAVCLEYKLINL